MNYHDICIAEVVDEDRIGVSTGSTTNGTLRVCVSLEGPMINQDRDLDKRWGAWRSLSLPAAKHLHELLSTLQHLWEDA